MVDGGEDDECGAKMTDAANSATDDLARYLDSLQREDRYRVDCVLKESAYEVTQRVFLVDGDGAVAGPFIRKFIKRELGLGTAYERIFEKQQQGAVLGHVPHIYECYSRDDELVVVMQLVAGQTLQDLVYSMDSSVELARAVFPTVCDAVSELHEAFDPPIIHRDLKPSNVIVTLGEADVGLANCKATIIDFGIARGYREGAEADTSHFGTRDFAPPEQFGYGQTSESSDVYALGMLLYFCLTEQIPTSAVRQAGFADPRIPEGLRRLIVQATSFDPDQRFGSARALKRAFVAAVNGERPQLAKQPAVPTAAAVQAADAGPAASKPAAVPHILGRVWNVFVLGFSVFVVGYMTYLLCTGGLVSPDHVPYSPAGSAVSYICGIVLTTALALACLDKRRIRVRVPALANVRPWQLWALVAICYFCTTFVRSIIS